ncbi:MAG: putative homoserine dehydrogenase-like protein [Akkermansiaceae bacterium]|jgi:predicted homoserine dehydrogenase-like protein
MDLAWQCEGQLEELEAKLKEEPIDVFVEACGNIPVAAEAALMAIECHAHVILTDARVDVAVGLTLATEANQHGIIVTSDAGTPHGVLATMIQEAHIMGFQTVQAGQISPRSTRTQFLYEMAALANGFGFLPPEGGMVGPEIEHLSEALSAFDLESYGNTPRIDFVRGPEPGGGLYLIVTPKPELPEEQITHLRDCQLGNGPYYLLQRNYHLGHLETPKAILGAAAGQPILSPGYRTCDLYASLKKNLPSGTKLKESHLEAQLSSHHQSKIPLVAVLEGSFLKANLGAGTGITFSNTSLHEGEQ